MRCLTILDGELRICRLGFGTGSLHHQFTSSSRQALLSAAFESGITHFDTAPLYGLGIAEKELGKFARSRRHKVTIATKVGLYPRYSASTTAALWLRKAQSKLAAAAHAATRDWSVASAERSFAESLRRLKTDHVDLLLVHEPEPSALCADAWLTWLNQQVARGSARAWGLAGDVRQVMEWVERGFSVPPIVQVRDSIDRCEADRLDSRLPSFRITYGYLSAAARSRRPLAGTDVLTAALRRNNAGSVLISTRRLSRVRSLAAVADSL